MDLTSFIDNKRVSAPESVLLSMLEDTSPQHLIKYFCIEIGFQVIGYSNDSFIRKHKDIENLTILTNNLTLTILDSNNTISTYTFDSTLPYSFLFNNILQDIRNHFSKDSL